MASSIEVILNAGSGAQRAGEMETAIAKVLREAGRSFQISVAKGNELARVAREKAASDCEILVAAGGDGTICTVAEAALKTGKTLGVVPLGTFNYFARNLEIPIEVEAATRVILTGKPMPALVLELDGRLVLNNSSLGIHPAVLIKRRKLYRRWGRNQLNAYLSVILTAFRPPPRLRVRLATDGGEVVRETPAVLVCSNAYQMETFKLVGKECLAAGKFAVYLACMAGRFTTVRLGLRTMLRTLTLQRDYEVFCVSDVTVETVRRKSLSAAVDGELEHLESPMRFQVAPKALTVLVPREIEAQGAVATSTAKIFPRPNARGKI